MAKNGAKTKKSLQASKRRRAETTGRRVAAARMLRGYSRTKLGKLMAKTHQCGVQDPKRLEDGSLILRGNHVEALVYHLRVPPIWFSNPDAALVWPKDEDARRLQIEQMFRDFQREAGEDEPEDDASAHHEAG